MPTLTHKLLIRGQRLSSIAIISTAGVLDCQIVHGTANGEVFYEFVQSRVLPHLMPFNGVNPHSVLVLDNASIHHVDGIMRMVELVGVLVCFFHHTKPH